LYWFEVLSHHLDVNIILMVNCKKIQIHLLRFQLDQVTKTDVAISAL